MAGLFHTLLMGRGTTTWDPAFNGGVGLGADLLSFSYSAGAGIYRTVDVIAAPALAEYSALVSTDNCFGVMTADGAVEVDYWLNGSVYRRTPYNGGASAVAGLPGTAASGVLGVTFNPASGQISWWKDGALIGSYTEAAFVGAACKFSAGFGGGGETHAATANFGAMTFSYPIAGFDPV